MADNPVRMRRLTTPDGNLRMVPLDHGVSDGPIEGLVDLPQALAAVAPHASCVTTHKGWVTHVADHARGVGVLMHLSASTAHAPDPNDKRLVATVEEAVRMGCDGVSIHVNLGAVTEPDMLQDAGAVATACREWGMPLVAMVYPRGPAVQDPHDPVLVAHAARLGAELGADAVKVPYTGDRDSFSAVVAGCPVPVVVAGGPRREAFEAFLADLDGAREAGARGVSIGRNVFQHPQPGKAMAAIAERFP